MKKYTFLPIILLSLFLLNCGNSQSKTSTPNSDSQLLATVKNPELKQAMEEVKKTKKLRDADTLLLALDEGTEAAQIEYIRYFTANAKIPLAALYAVLFKAALLKKETVMKALLNQITVDVKIQDAEHRSLIHCAVIFSTPAMVDYLRLKGFPSNASSDLHGTPVHYLLAGPWKLDNKFTNDPEARKAILGILSQDPKINLKLKNPAGETAEELATNLANLTTDNKQKEFYTWAAKKLAELAPTK